MTRIPFYLKTLGGLSLRAGGPDGPELIASSKPLAVLAIMPAGGKSLWSKEGAQAEKTTAKRPDCPRPLAFWPLLN